MKRLSITLGIILSICALVGTVFSLDQRFAKTCDIEEVTEYARQVAMRLDQKILQDQQFDLQKRLWGLEDRCKKEQCTQVQLNEIMNLKRDLQRVEEKLKTLSNSKG